MTSLFQRLAIWAAIITIIAAIIGWIAGIVNMWPFYRVMVIIIFSLCIIAVILGYTEKNKNQ